MKLFRVCLLGLEFGRLALVGAVVGVGCSSRRPALCPRLFRSRPSFAESVDGAASCSLQAQALAAHPGPSLRR
jgi:hypothetical protein